MADFELGRKWAALLTTRPVEAWDRMQKSRALARGMKSIREDARGWSQGLDVISAQGDWMQPVHQRLGWNWPCDESSAFQKCWADIEQMLVAADPTEPYYDADPVMARSLWCAVRHLQPRSVVETGVARGVTSRIILEALAGNGAGRLWSIDLPPLNEPWFSQSRSAVPQSLGMTGITSAGQRARAHLSSGGIIVSDDVNTNRAFTELVKSDHKLDGVVITQQRKRDAAMGIAWQLNPS